MTYDFFRNRGEAVRDARDAIDHAKGLISTGSTSVSGQISVVHAAARTVQDLRQGLEAYVASSPAAKARLPYLPDPRSNGRSYALANDAAHFQVTSAFLRVSANQLSIHFRTAVSALDNARGNLNKINAVPADALPVLSSLRAAEASLNMAELHLRRFERGNRNDLPSNIALPRPR